MNFRNRVVLITGANRGIGRAILENFLIHGAFVVGTATTDDEARNLVSFLKSRGMGIKLDFLDRSSMDLFFRTIHHRFDKIDILINNAGTVRDRLLIRMKETEWNSVMRINLTSVFSMSKNIVPLMMKKRYGRVISIGSVVGWMGNTGQSNYSASKSGLVGLSKSLAREVAKYGITVNVVSPGWIETGMTKTVKTEKILSRIPMNRLGTPQDVADAVSFLASQQASYITGETLHVNGGMCMF